MTAPKPSASPIGPDRRLAVNARDLAELLGVSERLIQTLSTTDQIPAPVRLGTCPRWPLAEIRAWLEAGGPCRERWDAIKASGRGAA